MRAVVTGSRCPHRYGAIVRRGEEKTIQQHRNSVAELRSGEAMWEVARAAAQETHEKRADSLCARAHRTRPPQEPGADAQASPIAIGTDI